MGAWSYCKPRFENLVGCKVRVVGEFEFIHLLFLLLFFLINATFFWLQICYCGREASGPPAVGIGELHKAQAAHVIKAPFL